MGYVSEHRDASTHAYPHTNPHTHSHIVVEIYYQGLNVASVVRYYQKRDRFGTSAYHFALQKVKMSFHYHGRDEEKPNETYI